MSRFVVATVDGWLNDAPTGVRRGLSAHVLDTLRADRVVALFRSEDYARTLPVTKGGRASVDVAREAAEHEAARLNRLEVFAA